MKDLIYTQGLDMVSFTQLPSYKKLLSFSSTPPDLREILTLQRIEEYRLEVDSLQLFYATERIDNSILSALFSLAEEARVKEKMEKMQKGEILNSIAHFPSENRAVLHTVTRDIKPANITPGVEKAQKLALSQLEDLQRFLEEHNNFSHLVQIGIGGSSLGPEAFCLALEAYKIKGRSFHFIANVDPDEAACILQELDLSKTLVVVVSKTGSTLETVTNEALARSYFEKEGINPNKHFVAISAASFPQEKKQTYLTTFSMDESVGGRFSTTSMVGMLAISFLIGFEKAQQFLQGAHVMDMHALNAPISSNLPLVAALLALWNRNFLQLPTLAVIPYSHGLRRLCAHLQQLEMESNGKQIDKEGNFVPFPTVPVVWGEVGTNGQHSFFQMLHQGTDIVPIEFIGCRESQYGKDISVEKSSCQQKLMANLCAQMLSLAQGEKNSNPNQIFLGNRPSRLLLLPKLTPYAAGQLLAFYEHKVAFQGFLWNINSFDQEGVQLGKKWANRMLHYLQNPIKEDLPAVHASMLKKLLSHPER